MNFFQQFILYSFVPIFSFFLLERFFFAYYFKKTERRKNFIRNTKFLHPNNISKFRYPVGVLCVVVYHFFSPQLALFIWGISMISDITDGTIARHYKMSTPQGASIDPLSDKLMLIPPLVYLVYLEVANIWLVSTFVILDLGGQYLRRFKAEKRANVFGKAKAFLIVICVGLAYVQLTYWGKVYWDFSDRLLVVIIGLSVASIFFRFIPNNWYGNFLTFTNFSCGVAGIILIASGFRVEYAFLLIFFGQFLDLYDGRAVRRWGGTLRGELYDDIADGTNFGGTVAFIVLATVKNWWFSIPLALIYLYCTIYRLYRFIKNKREQNIASDKGVSTFVGMPSPAGAFFVSSSLILLEQPYFFDLNLLTEMILKIAIVLFSSFLMISKISYIHFAQEIIPRIPNIIQAVSMIGIILLILWSLKYSDFFLLVLLFWIISVTYLIFGNCLH